MTEMKYNLVKSCLLRCKHACNRIIQMYCTCCSSGCDVSNGLLSATTKILERNTPTFTLFGDMKKACAGIMLYSGLFVLNTQMRGGKRFFFFYTQQGANQYCQ